MPAGTAIIGRVAVKVIPDTSKFKEELRAKLDVEEKKAKPLVINTTVDMKGALIALREGLLKINEENKNLDSRKIKFRTAISTVGMPAAIRDAVRELNALAAKEEIKFHAGTIGTGKVQVELDQAALDHVKKEMDHWVRANSPLKIPVHPTWTTTKAEIIQARLDILTRPRRVPIIPELNDGAMLKVAAGLAALSGARVLREAGEDVGNFIRNLDTAVPAIAGIGTALIGLTGLGLTAASNILAFGSSLVAIAPAALALPGILGGTAIGVGVMVAAFKDFNKVFPDVKASLSALQDTISNNFWDKAKAPMRDLIDSVLPELQSGFGQTATKLGGFFGAFSTSIKSTLLSELAGMFTDLSKSIDIAATGTDAYAGIITTLGKVGAGYLPRLAQWFVDISVRFDAFLSKAAADGRLQGWIDTAIQALKDLGRIVANIAGIFAGLAKAAVAAGGSTFGLMADTLERVNRAVSSPAFQTGLTSVLFAAHQAMNAIATQSGPGVSAFFENFANILTAVLPQVGTIIGSLVDGIGRALSNPAFTSGFLTMFDGIEKAINSLYPAFTPLGAAIGALGPVIGAMAANLGPLVTQLITGLQPAFTKTAEAVTPLIPILGSMLSGAISGLLPIVNGLVGAFSFLAEQAAAHTTTFKTVIIAALVLVGTYYTALAVQSAIAAAKVVAANVLMIGSWIAQGVTIAGQIVFIIGQIILYTATTVASLAATAAGYVATAAVAIFNFGVMIAGYVALGVSAMASALVMAAAWIIALGPIALVIVAVVALVALIILNWDTVKNATIAAWNAVVGFLTGAWDGIVNFARNAWDRIVQTISAAWEAVKSTTSNAIGAAVAFVASLPGRYVAAISSLVSALGGVARDAWSAFSNACNSAVGGVLSFFGGIGGRIKDAMGNLGSLLSGAGKAIIDGFVDSITSAFGKVRDAFNSLTSMIPDWKGPPKTDAILLVNAGQLVIGGFIDGLESRYEDVHKSLRGLSDDLGKTAISVPDVTGLDVAGKASIAVSSNLADNAMAASQKTLNYYAAAGNSLSSEESLWDAADRARMVGW